MIFLSFILSVILVACPVKIMAQSQPHLSEKTLTVCKDLAERAKGALLGETPAPITISPFQSLFNETVPLGCSFTNSSKLRNYDKLTTFFSGHKWKDVASYDAYGATATSVASMNSQTICFVSEISDASGDDTDVTEETEKNRERKPWTLTVNCTDLGIFNSIPHK